MNHKKITLFVAMILILGIASMSFAAFEHFATPRFDDLSFKVIKTEDATTASLLADEIDMMGGPGKQANIDAVVAAGYNQTWDPSASYGHMQIMCRDYFPPESGPIAGNTVKPLNDSDWRKAMTYVFGMDRKATSIYDYYQGPQVFAAENIIPSAQAYWYDGTYVFPNTDLDEAWTILSDAGYTVDAGVLKNPDGTPVRDMTVLYSADALSWQKIAGDFVSYMNEFMDYVGATTSPDFELVAEDFMTLVYALLEDHNFDMLCIGLTGLGQNPDWMCDMFHQDYIGAWYWNTVGLEDAYATSLMEIIWHNMDVPTVLAACHDWQDYFREIVPHFPMTWSYAIATYDPDLDDFIPTKCFGSVQNEHQFSTMNWEGTPVGGLLRRPLGDEPGDLHPWYDDTLYGWLILDMSFGSQLISAEPSSLKQIPWIAYDWSMEVVAGGWPAIGITEDGTKITFKLRNDVTWQDGTPLTAHDAKFHLDMMMKYNSPRYALMWDGMVYAETDGDYILSVYYEGTSLWQLDNVVGCLRAPKHIWSIIDEMVDNGTLTDIKTFDPQTPYAAITGVAPPVAYPYMKAGEVGCGPYVFEYYDPSLFIGEVHKYNEYWAQSPVEAAVNAYYRVDPGDTLEYSIVLLNTGAVGNSLENAIVDTLVYVDGSLAQTINDTTVNFLDYAELGPYTTPALAIGEHNITVRVYDGELIDTYVHVIHATIKQDINLDHKVRVDDVLAAAVAFGSGAIPYHVRWDPRVDINDDFRIRVDDILAIALVFGWP